MEIWMNPEKTDPCILVLGMFDGVHMGHQSLIMTGMERAAEKKVPLYVCTFEPHPLHVLFPDRAPKLLTTLQERAGIMEGFGVDALCVHTFTREMAAQEPEAFLASVQERYSPREVICGYNFTFGRSGRGSGDMLRAWGSAHGVDVEIIPEVRIADEAVSSTRIRGELESGNIRMVNRLLGHAYMLSGKVLHGKGIGHTLGFATANIGVDPEKALPAFGVYLGVLRDGENQWKCMVNIGRHPTLPEGGVTVEAHVLDAHPDLYDREVTLDIYGSVRPEIRFENVDALVEQLKKDRAKAKAFFGMA